MGRVRKVDGVKIQKTEWDSLIDDYISSSESGYSQTIPLEQVASYIITRSDSTYYARNGDTGVVTSGTIASTIINNAFNDLTSGRTWKEKVILRGTFNITDTIKIPSFTILEIQGKLEMSVTKSIIENIDKTGGNQEIDVVGGVLNREGTGCALLFEKVTNGKIINVRTTGAVEYGLRADLCEKIDMISCKSVGSNIGFNSRISHDTRILGCIGESNIEQCFQVQEESHRNILDDNIARNSPIGFLIDGWSTLIANNQILGCNYAVNIGSVAYLAKLSNNVITESVTKDIFIHADANYVWLKNNDLSYSNKGIQLGSGFYTVRIEGNEGYNPKGYIANPVGSQGWTLVDDGVGTIASDTLYYNYSSPKDIYIQGGTVTSVQVNGQEVFTETNVMVHLEYENSLKIIWTSAPTIKVMGV